MTAKFENKTWKEFKEETAHKDIYLFGASVGAEHCLEAIASKFQVKGIFDSDKNKWGEKLRGLPILSPNMIQELNKENIAVLITSNYLNEISQKLETLKVKLFYSYRLLNTRQPEPSRAINKNKIEELKAILSDEQSILIVEKILEKRMKGMKNYSDICTLKQYFLSEIFEQNNDEVFVDGGAYDGDSIKQFLAWANGKFRKIYAFEPDKSAYKQLSQEFLKYSFNILKINKGLWNKEENLYFTSERECNRIVEFGNIEIQTTSIDEEINEEVTFIKMDIEGAELKALEGAKKTIQKYKPKLAICIYHRQDDLFEIPLYIHKLVPEYKIYVRHHDIHYGETVMYADYK